MTLEGEMLNGELEAPDKAELAKVLWSNKLFLVWWKELGAEQAESIDEKLSEQIARTGLDLFISHLSKVKLFGTERPLGSWNEYPSRGILLWIANHSRGAITNKKQALTVFLIVLLVSLGTGINLHNCFHPRMKMKITPLMRAEMSGKMPSRRIPKK
jgi:hypothetical protein